MTLKQDSKSEENCNLKTAKAGHSSNICLSSPNAPVLHKILEEGTAFQTASITYEA